MVEQSWRSKTDQALSQNVAKISRKSIIIKKTVLLTKRTRKTTIQSDSSILIEEADLSTTDYLLSCHENFIHSFIR